MAHGQASEEVPVVKIVLEKSTIKFGPKASVPIAGVFDNWDATLTFKSTAPESGVVDIKIQAASGYREQHEVQQAREQGFLQRRSASVDHVSLHQGRADRALTPLMFMARLQSVGFLKTAKVTG